MKIQEAGRFVVGLGLMLAATYWIPAGVAAPEEEVLSLSMALQRAMASNPDLAVQELGVQMAEAWRHQARAFPNPVLELAVDAYDRAGAGLDASEREVTLTQPFAWGSKRRSRLQVAGREADLAGWYYADTRIEVLAETSRRFIAVLAAQARFGLAESAVVLAEKSTMAVAARVTAGKAPQVQETQSAATLELVRLDVQSARSALDVARRRLAAMWAAEHAVFSVAEGRLARAEDQIPDLAVLLEQAKAHPALARRESARQRAHALLAGERAARIPDLAVSFGYRQYEEDGTDAFAFGLELPLPLFDRNAGNIAAAEYALAQQEREYRSAELALTTDLREAHAALSMLGQRVTILQDKVVPAMEQAYAAAHEGYRQGKLGFLELLDTQRSLLEVQNANLDAQEQYQYAWIEIRRLTAMIGDTILKQEEK